MSKGLEKVKYIRNLKQEQKILIRTMNLYYFDRNKRRMLFDRLEKVEKEIERVENDENCDLWKPCDEKQKKIL